MHNINQKNTDSLPQLQSLRSRADLFRQKSASLLHQNSSPTPRQFWGLYTQTEEGILDRISLYYVTGWKSPHCHYTTTQNKWTALPGKAMTRVTEKVHKILLTIFPKLLNNLDRTEEIYEIHIGYASAIEFLLNENGTEWDKPSTNSNYKLNSPGKYLVKQGKIFQIFNLPEKPSFLEAIEIGSSHILLSWNKPLVEEDNILSYKIYRDEKLIKTLDNKTTQYKDLNLLGKTKYVYRVAAVNHNEVQGKYSDALEVVTGEPGKAGAVEHLGVVTHSTNKIEIAWQKPLDLGGASIESYLIFKNAAFVDVKPHSDELWQHWTDKCVEPKTSYVYHVVTSRLKPEEILVAFKNNNSKKALNESNEEETRNIIQQYLQKQPLSAGQITLGIEAKSLDILACPKLSDTCTHIILQAFTWDSCHDKQGWYNVLQQHLDLINSSAITMVWLPPPSMSVSPQGYMPTRWYNLNSAYGTEAELLDLIENLRAQKITAMLDFVANHRCGVRRDDRGEWTIFEDPNWESWAIVKNNLVGYTGLGEFDTGEQNECAPDLDHKNAQVQNDIKKWLTWLFDIIGFGAMRIDMAPGYAPMYQIDYVRHVKTPFTVAEYWSGDTSVLHNFIRATQGLLALYDFALYYILKRSIIANDFHELSENGCPPGLLGRDPERSVTFIENHDTEHLNYVGKFADGNQNGILRGIVYILTHPGVPCVYLRHFLDHHLREKIIFLCKLRQRMNIHSSSSVYIDAATQGLYAAYISNDHGCSRGGGVLAIKLGTADWSPSGSWKFQISGEQFSVWSK